MPNSTDCRLKLKKLRAGKSLLLSPTNLTNQEKQLWYYAARQERMKVSIRTLQRGTFLEKVTT